MANGSRRSGDGSPSLWLFIGGLVVCVAAFLFVFLDPLKLAQSSSDQTQAEASTDSTETAGAISGTADAVPTGDEGSTEAAAQQAQQAAKEATEKLGTIEAQTSALIEFTGLTENAKMDADDQATLLQRIESARGSATGTANNARLLALVSLLIALIVGTVSYLKLRKLSSRLAELEASEAAWEEIKEVEDASAAAQATKPEGGRNRNAGNFKPDPSQNEINKQAARAKREANNTYHRDGRDIPDDELPDVAQGIARREASDLNATAQDGQKPQSQQPEAPAPNTVAVDRATAAIRDLVRGGGTVLSGDYQSALEAHGQRVALDISGDSLTILPGEDDGLPRPLEAIIMDDQTAIVVPSHNYLKHFSIQHFRIRDGSNTAIKPFFDLELNGSGSLGFNKAAIGRVDLSTRSIAVTQKGQLAGFTN